ncbi:sigma-70 family RNA polymerase sigma factor [Streptomyces sp. NPDC005500]|uniref:RNA polymerase sigma factor n=1 Tax=Streptomyces sp. NPDC005500 TaxID=3155007 RepID=UPI0033AA4E77
MSTTFDTPTLEERFSRGDETALPEMYRRFSGPMFVTALSLLGNREHAAEAVQQAFVQAWRAAASFDPKRELQPWLYAITRRTAVDTYRRERRNAMHVSLDESWAGEGELAAEGPSMETAWRVWQVREALDQLHPDERQVLHLAYFEGFTQSEIAKTLGIALGTVKSRTARAQRRLAQLLAHVRDAEDDPAQ